MKILCVCEGGCVRSVALARVLKDDEVCGYSHDALAASWRWNSRPTLDMLCAWADLIVVMEPYMREKLSDRFEKKITVCDVGPDTYGTFTNPDLFAKCVEFAKGLSL